MPIKMVCLSMILFGFVNLVKGQNAEQYIYKITIGCGRGCRQKIQTGFKLANVNGIFTSLHGLTEYTALSAENAYGNYSDLEITKVDVKRDVALISNSELQNDYKSGLVVSPSNQISSGIMYKSFGFPHSTSMVPRDDIRMANPPLIRLKSRIPDDEIEQYRARNSPSPDINVIETRYNFGFGESGAPILNQQNQVIGIHDGGFDNINISWNIPIQDVYPYGKDLVNFTNGNRYSIFATLRSHPIGLAHDYAYDLEREIGKDLKSLSNQIEDWYFSFMKLMIAYNKQENKATFDPLKYFEVSTLSNRLKNVLGVNLDSYSWVVSQFSNIFEQEINTQEPVDFIPIDVKREGENRNVFTVFFRYSKPLYAYMTKNGFADDTYFFTFSDGDSLEAMSKNGEIQKLKGANIQGIFILDDNFKLVDLKDIKIVLSDEPNFQKN
jgi:hypothetical protein